MAELLFARKGNIGIVTFAQKEILDLAKSNAIGVEFREMLERSGASNILVDLASVKLITSSMIGEFLKLLTNCRAADVGLKLCGMSSDLTMIFKKLKLDKTFSIYASRELALTAFEKNK